MGYPDFVGIGHMRSATTWLHTVLSTHPAIWLPPLKELHYFDVIDPSVKRSSFRYKTHLRTRLKHNLGAVISSVGKGVIKKDVIFDPGWDMRYFLGRAGEDWYKRLFQKQHELGMVAGEITPAYSLLSPEFIRRILSVNREMKFIYLMRDPIDRSWSNAVKLLSRDAGVELSDVSDEDFLCFYSSEENLGGGSYSRTIKKYLSIVDTKQFLPIFFDDIKANPTDVLNEIFSFLGVNSDELEKLASLEKPVNVASHGYNIPEKHARFLASLFHDDIEELSNMYDRWPGVWLNRINGLLAEN